MMCDSKWGGLITLFGNTWVMFVCLTWHELSPQVIIDQPMTWDCGDTNLFLAPWL